MQQYNGAPSRHGSGFCGLLKLMFCRVGNKNIITGFTYVCIDVYMYVYVCIYVSMYVCIIMCVCMCV